MTEFDRGTAVRPGGDGAFQATIDERWNVLRGPHGGYVAAILLRAMTEALGDGTRMPRALTVFYPAAPRPGTASVACRVERAGRSMTTVTARIEQDGAAAALATAAFSAEWPEAIGFDHSERPEVPDPEAIEPLDRGNLVPPFTQFVDFRPAVGGALMSGADRAISGGWMRLREDHALDAPLVAMLADAWPPAVFPPATSPLAAPTIELSVYFRAPLPAADDWVLGVFESKHARGGFFEEDGTLWTRDGELIAQCRQLALALAFPGG
ncbi:MAG: thioesterase family protein [Actinomycetota bacterium]|nr:thioesterase family protein [Actinomycetota bacterium]